MRSKLIFLFVNLIILAMLIGKAFGLPFYRDGFNNIICVYEGFAWVNSVIALLFFKVVREGMVKNPTISIRMHTFDQTNFGKIVLGVDILSDVAIVFIAAYISNFSLAIVFILVLITGVNIRDEREKLFRKNKIGIPKTAE